MRRQDLISSQPNQSYQHSIILLILLVALCLPLMLIFTLYPWFCLTKMQYLDIWIFLLFGAWLIYQFFIRSNENMNLIKTYFDDFIVLTPCLIIILCLPLPAHALRLLSFRLFEDTKWITTQADWIFNAGDAWNHISYWPQQSIQISMHCIACLLIYFLIIHTVKTRLQLSAILYSLLACLSIGTLAGCLFFYDWSETTSFQHVNHHMALILNILIAMFLGGMLTFYKKTRKPVFKTFSYSFKVSLKNWIWGEQALLTRMALICFLFFGFLLFARPLGLKMLGLSLALILGGILLTGKPKMRSQFIVWSMVGLLIGLYALISNTKAMSNPNNQLLIEILKDNPWVGVGPGALPVVWFTYSDIPLTDHDGYHTSAWLTFLAEYGILGMSFWGSAIIVFFIRMNNMWQKRQSVFNVGWGLGIMMALIATVFLGGGYDLGNPYIVLPIIAVLAACSFLVLHAGHRSSRQSFFYRKVTIKRKSWHVLSITGIILALLFIGIFQLAWSSKKIDAVCDQFETHSESEVIQALKNNKYNAELWYQMANWYQKQDADAVNYMKTYLPRADISYEMACYLAPKNDRILFESARYWVWRSNVLSDDPLSDHHNNVIPKTKHQAIILFQKRFKNILLKHPEKYQSVIDEIWQWYRDDTIVLDAIPGKHNNLKQTALEYVLLQKNN